MREIRFHSSFKERNQGLKQIKCIHCKRESKIENFAQNDSENYMYSDYDGGQEDSSEKKEEMARKQKT